MERKIGEIFEYNGEWYQCVQGDGCNACAFANTDCDAIPLGDCAASRRDRKPVLFKKLEKVGEPYFDENSVVSKRLFQKYRLHERNFFLNESLLFTSSGDIVSIEIKQPEEEMEEKKQEPPRSWKEFCERYPVKKGEAVIDMNGNIHSVDIDLAGREHRNWNISKEEAEAFLALMQLRQLRKAWVGDWETRIDESYGVIFPHKGSLKTALNTYTGRSLSFPTREMAEDFLNCFRDLCEAAKILL